MNSWSYHFKQVRFVHLWQLFQPNGSSYWPSDHYMGIASCRGAIVAPGLNTWPKRRSRRRRERATWTPQKGREKGQWEVFLGSGLGPFTCTLHCDVCRARIGQTLFLTSLLIKADALRSFSFTFSRVPGMMNLVLSTCDLVCVRILPSGNQTW